MSTVTGARLIRHFPSIDSTNEHALTLAAAGAAEGTVVVADEQTAGRGRRGRDWYSPEGGLYLSYVVRDVTSLPRPSLLTLAAGVAAARAIEAATGLAPQLKWPNDVMTPREPSAAGSSGARKLAGILTEGSSVGSRLEFAVIGIGINVSLASVPPALAAIAASLEEELGRAVERDALQAALIAELDDVVRRLRQGAHARLLEDWVARAPMSRGAAVSWRADGVDRHGVTAGVSEDGALLVRAGPSVEALVAGEVIWT